MSGNNQIHRIHPPRVHPEILGLASNGQIGFAAWPARFTRISVWRSRLCQCWTRSVCAEVYGNGPPDPRMVCAEIGPVCSRGRALQRSGRVKALYLSPKTLAAPTRHDRFDKSEKCDIIRGPCEGEILTVKELRVSSPCDAPRCRGKA